MSGGVDRSGRAAGGEDDRDVSGPAAAGGAAPPPPADAAPTDADIAADVAFARVPRASGFNAGLVQAAMEEEARELAAADTPAAAADEDDWQVTRPPVAVEPEPSAPAAPPPAQLPDLSNLPPAGEAAELVRLAAGSDREVADLAQARLEQMGALGIDAAAAAWPNLSAAEQRRLLPLFSSEAAANHPGAIDSLLEATRSPDPQLAGRAAQFLAYAAQLPAASPFVRAEAARRLAAMAAEHPDPVAQEEAAKWLFQLARSAPEDPATFEALSTLARNPDARVARYAAQAYASPEIAGVVNREPLLRQRAFADLRELEKTAGRAFGDDVYDAMSRIATKEARARLVEVAKGPNASARAAAMRGLANDPSTADLLIEAALTDPSDVVKEDARNAVRNLVAIGDPGEKAELYAKLREAARRAGGDATTKEVFEETARGIADEIGESFASDTQRLEALSKAYESGDAVALAEYLRYAPPGTMMAFEAQLKRDGKTIDDVLVDLRARHPQGYAEVIEGFTEYSNIELTAARRPPGIEVYKRALIAHLKAHPDAIDDFARPGLEARGNRYYPDPRLSTVAILGALAPEERAAAALIKHGAQSDEMTRDAIWKELAKRPDQTLRLARAQTFDPLRPEVERDFAARVLVRSGGAEGKKLAAGYFGPQAQARVGELTKYHDAVKESAKATAQELGDLIRLKQLHDAGHGKLEAAEYRRLLRDIDGLQGRLDRYNERMEKLAGEVEKLLSDPEAAAALATLPPDEVRRLVGDGVRCMKGTAAAQRFFERAVAPAIQDPSAGGIVAELLKGADPLKDAVADTIGEFAPQIAAKGEAFATLALRKMVGRGGQTLSDADFKKVYDALDVLGDEKASDAAKTAARETLGEKGFKGNTLEKLGVAWSGIQFAIGMRELMKDPSLKNALSTAKDTAELTQAVAELAKSSPKIAARLKHAAAVAKWAGAAAGALQAVTSTMDMVDSMKRQDLAGAYGDFAQVLGGGLMVAGAFFPPAAALGAIITLGGAVGKWIWGDSDEEQRLKAIADKYDYDYHG